MILCVFLYILVVGLKPSGDILIPGDACEYFMKLYTAIASSAGSVDSDGIACLGQMLVCMANGNWKEAKEFAERGVVKIL